MMPAVLWIVSSCVGVGVLVALALVYRRAAAHRALELANQLLDEEYARLAPPAASPADRSSPREP